MVHVSVWRLPLHHIHEQGTSLTQYNLISLRTAIVLL